MSGKWHLLKSEWRKARGKKRARVTSAVSRLLLALVALILAVPFGDSGALAGFADRVAFTIPTRTPTPAAEPTEPPPPPPTNPPPAPTNPPGATATPLPAITSTPDGAPLANASPTRESVPLAEPCAVPPTFRSAAWVNVRSGPGLDYPVVNGLTYLEVRPIIGRAEFAPWWLIELDQEASGWVADSVGTVHGYTGLLPIVGAPAIEGVSPTPGLAWEITPDPLCTVTPTFTPTAEPTATFTPAMTRSLSLQAALVPASTATSTPTQAAPSETPPSAEVTPPTPIPTAKPEQTEAAPQESLETEPVEEESGTLFDWLLFGGAGLVVAGLLLTVIQRFSRPG